MAENGLPVHVEMSYTKVSGVRRSTGAAAGRPTCMVQTTKAQKWPPHMFMLTGLQTKLSKQRAITHLLAKMVASIVGSETI
jgi:hypothetical protein